MKMTKIRDRDRRTSEMTEMKELVWLTTASEGRPDDDTEGGQKDDVSFAFRSKGDKAVLVMMLKGGLGLCRSS